MYIYIFYVTVQASLQLQSWSTFNVGGALWSIGLPSNISPSGPLWTQEHRDLNSDLIYEDTKAAQGVFWWGLFKQKADVDGSLRGPGCTDSGEESGWQVSPRAIKNGSRIRGYQGRVEAQLSPSTPQRKTQRQAETYRQWFCTVELREAKSEHWLGWSKGREERGWGTGGSQSRGSTLSQLSQSLPLQAGRAGSDLGGWRAKDQNPQERNTMVPSSWTLPSCHLSEGVLSWDQFWAVGFNIINHKAAGYLVVWHVCVYLWDGWLKSDVTLCEPKNRSVTAVIVA